MSHGPMPNYADTIETEKIAELCPEEFAAFKEACFNDEYVQDEDEAADADAALQFVARYMLAPGSEDGLGEEAAAAWAALQQAFTQQTGGLELELRYHNSDDDGGCYDEVNGLFWHVNGVYQLTPAGERFEDCITRRFFTIYG